ncbi:MAG TPA: hypothetical protein VFR89_00805, partial [candidate division Zixibacteria bacterium]|nr:hypothetical protein [candidate division Zixibacteria bacterium]
FGGDPFIDFANDAVSDYDARIQLQGNDGLQIAVPSILSVPTGKVGIGTTTPGSSAGLENTRLEIADGTGLNSDVALRVSGGGATGSAALNFAKSRGNLSTPTGVQSGDLLGHILFLGYDGSDFSSPAAWIQASVDGTPGTDDMPGRLEFKTTPDGSATPATRMTINNAGSVGIGTTSPTTRLHVLEDNDTLSALTIENPNTGTLSTEAILFNSEDGSGPASGASIFVTDGGHPSFPALMRINNSRPGGSIDFSTGNNRRMVIENGGDVGIGTLNAVNKLDVEGGVAIGAAYSGTSAAPANGLLVEGNVGIGLNNPTTPLSVAGQISQSGGTAAAPAYTFVGDLNTGIFQPNADAIGISTLGLARVTVTNFGEVGIGTTSPDVPLHVEGGVDATLANGSGYAVIGSVGASNLVFDNNEIQARSIGAASNMF